MKALKDPVFFGLIRDYFNVYLPKQKKVSINTKRAYQNALESLLDYTVESRHIKLADVTFDTIDHVLLYEFLEWLETEKHCSVSTRNHRLQCIRAFYSYVAETEPTVAIYKNEILKVKPALAPKNRKIDYMSENAVQAVLAAPDTDTAKGVRDTFMMVLLYDTGARIQEILDIRLSDIHHFNSTLTMRGKGRKIRSVSLVSTTMRLLRKYLNLYHSEDDIASDELLFYTIRNGIKRAMTTDNARKMISEYGMSAKANCSEVPENVHPHIFRHSRAMHLFQHGMPLALVSQWLGHSSIKTTLIYAYADTEMKRKAIEMATSPDSPLRAYTDSERYTISDDEMIKKLYGIT